MEKVCGFLECLRLGPYSWTHLFLDILVSCETAKAFIKLNNFLIEEFYKDNDYSTYKDFILLAIDGSTIQLPNAPQVLDEYGCMTNSTDEVMPGARISILYDVLNGLVLRSCLKPYKSDERGMAIEQDFHATILLVNSHALLALEAGEEVKKDTFQNSKKYEYCINNKVSLEALKNEFVAILLDSHSDVEWFCKRIKK